MVLIDVRIGLCGLISRALVCQAWTPTGLSGNRIPTLTTTYSVLYSLTPLYISISEAILLSTIRNSWVALYPDVPIAEAGYSKSTMNRGDEIDQSGPNAPLLASDHAIPHHEGDHDHNDLEVTDPGHTYSGGRFIWALTCSAGISGLLFGYEYVIENSSIRRFYEKEKGQTY